MKSKFIAVLLIFSLISLFISPLNAQQALPKADSQFSKPFAIFLSVVSPGMGQVYSGQIGQGLSIWGASSILVMGFLTTVADFDFDSVGGAFPFNIGMKFKAKLNNEETFWAVGLGVTYAFLYLYNVLDISLFENSPVTVNPTVDGFTAAYEIRF